MYFISYKCVVGEVDNYCQVAVTFFFFFFLVSPYQTRDNVLPQFIFDPPFPYVWIRPWYRLLQHQQINGPIHKLLTIAVYIV